MKRILSVLFLLVMTVSMVIADKITEEKAYVIAARFMNGATGGVRKAKAGDNAEPMPEWEAELLAGETATTEEAAAPEAEQA